MNTHDAEELARKRHFIIAATRMIGVALVLLGILVTQGAIDWPEMIGYPLLIVGLFDVFVMPSILARKWRSNPE